MEGQAASWYAARTRFGQELIVKRKLATCGVDHFIPEKSNGKPAIACLVFLKTTRTEALKLNRQNGFRMKFIIDCATRTLLVVPDKQMEDFLRVWEVDDATGLPEDTALSIGDRVRVKKGPLKGVEGDVVEFHGKTYVVVNLLESVFAKAKVPRPWIEKI